MSFFNLSTGEQAQNTGAFEAVEAIKPIPNGTQASALISEAKWDEYQGVRYINLKWEIIEGEYKGRIIFQKVKVGEADPKKRDRAIKMLGAIDANAGGGLMRAGVEPDDFALQNNLLSKPMIIRTQVWEIDDKKGNWIDAVAPMNRGQQPVAQPVQQTQQAAPPAFDNTHSQDIDF